MTRDTGSKVATNTTMTGNTRITRRTGVTTVNTRKIMKNGERRNTMMDIIGPTKITNTVGTNIMAGDMVATNIKLD